MGREVQTRSRFRIDEQAHGTGELPWHSHDTPLLSLVLEGGYEEAYGRREFDCASLDVVVKPAGERHRDRVRGNVARSLLVSLSTRDDPELDRFVGELSEPRLVSQPKVRQLVRRAACEWRARDEITALALEAALLEIVVTVARGPRREREEGRSPSRPPGWLARADELLRASFRRSITLDELAHQCGVHPAHFARTFRRWRGSSVGETIRALRVDAAVRALAETDEPLAEVALSSGFYDQSHMGRALKRALGRTPLEIRTRARR